MKFRALFLIGQVAFITTVFAQNESTDSDTTPAPQETVVETSDYICRVCVCKDGAVDCTNQNLEKFFTEVEWAGLVDYKPIQVDLSNNDLTTVSRISTLPIEKLNLSHNAIESIADASFRNLTQIKVLDLSYNKLTSDKLSPHSFEGRYSAERYEPLGSMRTLSLAYNDLHSLHQDLFEHLPDLVELDLSGNPLAYVDYVTVIAISSLPDLEVLRLRSCQISEIPDKFLHTPRKLRHLDLSDNKLKAVPQELEETKNLAYLNLNQNPIVKLDKDDEDYPGFPTLKRLEELHMCNMPELVFVGEGTLAGLQNLKKLHMSYNSKLSSIHAKALARPDDIGETYDWPSIKEIYLQWNNLTEIDSRLLARWDTTDLIDVTNNPFLCDCSTQWMVDVLVPLAENKQVNSTNSMVCQEPVEMRGYTMKHLSEIHRKMRCLDKYGNRPEKDGAILLGALIGVLLAVPIMLSLVLLWRRGYFGWLGFRGPTEVSRAFYKRAPVEEANYI